MNEATDTIEAPPNQAPQSDNWKAAGDAFEQRLKAPDAIEAENDVTHQQPAKPAAPAPKVEPSTDTDGIPAHIMDGTEAPKVDAPKSPIQDILDAAPPPKLSQQQAGNWQTMRKALEEADRERNDLRTKLETVSKAPAPQVDDEALKMATERINHLTEELEKSSFERSPKFLESLKQKKRAIENAKSFIEGNESSGAFIEIAAGLKGAKRLAALKDAGYDTETVNAINSALLEVDKIEINLDDLIQDRKLIQAQDQQEAKARAAREEAQVRAEEETIFNTVLSQARSKFPALQKVEGNDAWNAQSEAIIQEAKALFNGSLSMEQMAEGALAAASRRVDQKIIENLRAALKTEREKTAGLTAAQPKVGDSNGAKPAANDASQPWTAQGAGARFDQRMAGTP